jgi:hypothetical protein
MKSIPLYIFLALIPVTLWFASDHIYRVYISYEEEADISHIGMDIMVSLNNRLEEILLKRMESLLQERRVLEERLKTGPEGNDYDWEQTRIRLDELLIQQKEMERELEFARKQEVEQNWAVIPIQKSDTPKPIILENSEEESAQKIVKELNNEIIILKKEADSLNETWQGEVDHLTSEQQEIKEENILLNTTVGQLNNNKKELEYQVESLADQNEDMEGKLVKSESGKNVLFSASAINGIFHPFQEELVISVKPGSEELLLKTGSFDVYGPGDRNQIKTRIQLYRENGKLAYRLYPGQSEPEAGDWF